MLTRQEIVLSVKQLQGTVAVWEALPDSPSVQWRGVPRKAVSGEVQQAACSLFDLVATMDVEEDARELVLSIDAFESAFTSWAELCQQRPDDAEADPYGGPSVWNSYQAVIAAMKPPFYARPEPVGALVASKVNHNQIAKIYGWYDAGGNPDVVKVQEELVSPGTHFDPKVWVHPSEKRRKSQIAGEWGERSVRVGANKIQGEAVKRPERQPAPESLDDLILSGVNSLQIAKMKRITQDDVRARAAELGVPLDGNTISQAWYKQTKQQEEEQRVSEQAEQMRLAAFDAHAELGDDLEARVIAIKRDRPEAKPRDIVKVLATAFPGLQHQKVTQVLKAWEPECTPKG